MTPNGSSPRMRGKPGWSAQRQDNRRIIPAHAGQTSNIAFSCANCSDHPRACGANVPFSAVCLVDSGSSPRMRGKLGDAFGERMAERIIPAHAGQTFALMVLGMVPPDHPRACGANCSFWFFLSGCSGSSPRMRGKRTRRCRRAATRRIIPAHAGQTVWLIPMP